MPTFETIFFDRVAKVRPKRRSSPMTPILFFDVGVDCRDDESNGSHRRPGGGMGRGVRWGMGAGSCRRFGGEAADDLRGSATDEAGGRSADLGGWQVGDVFGDGGGPGEELEGEPSL